VSFNKLRKNYLTTKLTIIVTQDKIHNI